MSSIDTVQQAVRDLALIRQAIDRAQKASQTDMAKREAQKANLIIQTISLSIVVCILLAELILNHSTTQFMMLSSQVREIGVVGLLQVGFALPLFIMCLYFIVWRSSRHGDQEFSVFVANNFRYLRSLSFIADLLIKFVMLSLVVLGGHPEWIGPVLVLFIGDYLFQGRFFNFSIKISLGLGLFCLGLSALLYLGEIHYVIWPLGVFAVVNALSLIGLIRNRSSTQITDEV